MQSLALALNKLHLCEICPRVRLIGNNTNITIIEGINSAI